MLESFYLAKYIRNSFFCDLNVIFVNADDYSITVVRSKPSALGKLCLVDVRRVLTCFRGDLRIKYRSLVDIWCIDYRAYFKGVGFELNYKFNSLKFPNVSLIYSVHLIQEISFLPVYVYSVSGFFSSANWLEREIWDLYGIFFYGHSDLRRILTDYGFVGYPFRKDYPVTGYTEVRYEDTKGYILYDPVSFTQGFRSPSNSFSSWYEDGEGNFKYGL